MTKAVKNDTKKVRTKSSATTKTNAATSDAVIVEPEVQTEPVVRTKTVKHVRLKAYFGYKTRLIGSMLLFAAFFSVSLLVATKTIERKKADPIVYTQKSDTEYKVYLKENEYYTEDYLGMNQSYVANLIDYIDVNFNYEFSILDKTNINFDYKVMADLIIENKSTNSRYLEKNYTIVDSKQDRLFNNSLFNVKQNVKIDYAYYNNLANGFKSDYGLDTNSYLNVYLEVEGKSDPSLNYTLNEDNKVNLRIPLSERAIEINLDKSAKDVTKQVEPVGEVVFNVLPLIGEIVLFVISCYFMNKVIKLITVLGTKSTAYDKYVNKILKTYDRLIVETKTEINMADCNIINVKDFDELLDVRDNLKNPIMYYNTIKHQKGMFYIKENNDVYLVTVKDVDLAK